MEEEENICGKNKLRPSQSSFGNDLGILFLTQIECWNNSPAFVRDVLPSLPIIYFFLFFLIFYWKQQSLEKKETKQLAQLCGGWYQTGQYIYC